MKRIPGGSISRSIRLSWPLYVAIEAEREREAAGGRRYSLPAMVNILCAEGLAARKIVREWMGKEDGK